jgi:pimeloyl-ACP methyl ester carboxylesterase
MDFDELSRHGHAVLMYDQRGTGNSELVSTAGNLTLASHVADLEALRRHFKLRRAKFGVWPVGPALWQLPQRLVPRTFSQKLMRNAWMSAVAGGGPEYVGPAVGGVRSGFSVVAAPPPQPDRTAPASRAIAASRATL